MDMILEEFKTSIISLEIGTSYWDRKTGKKIDGELTEVPFRGAVLPLSQDDLERKNDGGYNRHDRKIYCKKKLINKQQVLWNNLKWTVESDLDYDYIDLDFKRYYMRRVGKISD